MGVQEKRSIPGPDLLSRSVTRPVPSALPGLTSEFGMGSGISPALKGPEGSLVLLDSHRRRERKGSVVFGREGIADLRTIQSREQDLAH